MTIQIEKTNYPKQNTNLFSWENITNNQDLKADAGKPKLSLVPTQIIYDIAQVREYGNNKYPTGGTDNWKQVDKERYIDAAFRHLCQFINNPYGKDEESGLPHLSHLACNIAFLCELMHELKVYDKDEL